MALNSRLGLYFAVGINWHSNAVGKTPGAAQSMPARPHQPDAEIIDVEPVIVTREILQAAYAPAPRPQSENQNDSWSPLGRHLDVWA